MIGQLGGDMTTFTRDKLNEVRYQLSNMQNHSIQDAFRYDLNAFLAAARGLPEDVMWLEYNRLLASSALLPEFVDWFENHRLVQTNQPRGRSGRRPGTIIDLTIRAIRDTRNIAVHRQEVSTRRLTMMTLTGHTAINEGLQIISHDLNSGISRVVVDQPPETRTAPPDEISIERRWFFDGGFLNGRDVLTVCEQHMTELEEFVAYCETRYGP